MMQCSLGEGFGLPIIEAQACGCPVIGTDHPVINEIMGNGGSIVLTNELFMNYYMSNISVPVEADIIEELYGFYTKIYGNINVKAIANASCYDWQCIFPLWDDLLSKLF
jgi:glycosyltransferase involved in cell wall biosynthesis